MKEKLGPKGMWKEIAGANGSYELLEATASYGPFFDAENGDLKQKNDYF
jgi:hypothetical protein